MAERFSEFILSNQVIGFHEKPVRLKSGRESSWYVNWRTVTNDAYRLDRLTSHVLDFIQDLKWPEGRPLRCLYGVPEGATKTAIIANFKWAKSAPNFGPGSHTLSMGRAKPKEHGDPKDRFFIGAPVGGTLVLEDVTTSGGSLFQCVDQLLGAGVDVLGALSFTDRGMKLDGGRSVSDEFKNRYAGKIQYFPMSHALDLLPEAARRAGISKGLWARVQEEIGQEEIDQGEPS